MSILSVGRSTHRSGTEFIRSCHSLTRIYVRFLRQRLRSGILKSFCFLWTIRNFSLGQYKLLFFLETGFWKIHSLTDSTNIYWALRKGGQPWISLEGLMLKLKLQYFGHLMHTDNSLEKSPMLGKIQGRGEEGVRGWDGWTASPMQQTWTWANSGRWWGTGRPSMLQSIGLQRVRHDWSD